MNTEKKFNEQMDVAIDNLYTWDITFDLFTMKLNGNPSIIIPANDRENMQLTFAEIKKQINNRNIGFCGTGHGNHAPLRIVDLEIRKELLGDVDQIQFTDEALAATLKYKSKDAFIKSLNTLITNQSEAKMLCHKWDDLDVYNMDRWKENALAEKAAEFGFNVYGEGERPGTKDFGAKEPPTQYYHGITPKNYWQNAFSSENR